MNIVGGTMIYIYETMGILGGTMSIDGIYIHGSSNNTHGSINIDHGSTNNVHGSINLVGD